MEGNKTIEILMAHSSVRKFQDKAVPDEVVQTIIDCAQKAPTSSYLQAFSIIKVDAAEKRRALMEYSGGQEWVEKAPLVLLFCGDLHRTEQLVEPDDKNVLHNAELYTVGVIDASLVAQKAFIAAQAMGLGGVIVGGVRNETEKMAELFNLPKLVFPMFLLCLGYAEEIPEQRPRFPKKIVYAVDKYPDLPTDAEMNEYNQAVYDYFIRQTEGKSQRNWVDRAKFAITTKPRYCVGEFLEKAGFMTKKSESDKE